MFALNVRTNERMEKRGRQRVRARQREIERDRYCIVLKRALRMPSSPDGTDFASHVAAVSFRVRVKYRCSWRANPKPAKLTKRQTDRLTD